MAENEENVPGRKPSLARYLQNYILREDNSAMAFSIQKWNPEADRRDDSGKKGSYVAISAAKADYQQTPFAIAHIAANAIKKGQKPMVFFKLGTSSRNEDQLSFFLNITEGDGTEDARTTGGSAQGAASETNDSPLG